MEEVGIRQMDVEEVIWLLKSKERSEGYLQSRMRMQSRMATSAPVLSPAELTRASALHISMLPSRSHVHTRIVSVPVLLCMGKLPSVITTATRWVLLCIRPNPERRVKIPAVLSVDSWVLSLLTLKHIPLVFIDSGRHSLPFPSLIFLKLDISLLSVPQSIHYKQCNKKKNKIIKECLFSDFVKSVQGR